MKNFSEDNAIEIKYIHKDLYALKESITSNQNSLKTLSSNIESLGQSQEEKLGGLEERLISAEVNANTQGETLRVHSADITAHEARISALEQTSGGSAGTVGGPQTATDNFGTKYTTLADFTALLSDFETETYFGNRSIAKFPACLELTNGPITELFFRLNPLYTQKPHIALGIWFSNPNGSLPETFEFSVKLNGNLVIDHKVLTITSKKAFLEFDIDPATNPIVMFNTLRLTFHASNNMDNMFVDWFELEVSNAYNPIVLNRNTDYEIYGLRKNAGGHRIFSSKYNENGRWGFIGGDDPTLEDDYTYSQEYDDRTIQGRRIKWATRYPQQNFKSSGFSCTTNYHLDYLINQNNRLFANFSFYALRNLDETTDYLDNVRYAKKSLHNGKNEDVECACITFFDFSVGIINTRRPASRPENFFTPVTFNFNGEDYPKEFVDFIPVNDHNIVGLKTQKVSCGYFLHHKSGNILFVPETQSTYFIKVGKGRQVHAFLSQDNLKICVFFQVGNNVVQKTLTRATEESEWELTNNVKNHYNFEDIVPFQEFYYTIKNRDIQKIEDLLI